VEGPFPCNSADEADVVCGVFKLRIEAPGINVGPLDDPSLDDALEPLNIVIAVRAPNNEALCTKRWVTLDAGGGGSGYGYSFGKVGVGQVVPGDKYGDDLIKDYNNRGFVTVDILWQCNSGTGGPCDRDDLRDWAPVHNLGTGWYLRTGGTGYIGAGSRANDVYNWIKHNANGHNLCSHGHSSGSGRLMSVMTRFGGDVLFDTVVVDGGPVWAYVPWYCGTEEGPLGQPPSNITIDSCKRNSNTGECAMNFPAYYDCARSEGKNELSCSYDACQTGSYDEGWLDDSNFYKAVDRDFDLDLGIVLGGKDGSPAAEHARLWLSGYNYSSITIPGITANGIRIRQGYCESTSGTYSASRPCANWDPGKFPQMPAPDIQFDSRIVDASHSTVATDGGRTAAFELMSETCELNP